MNAMIIIANPKAGRVGKINIATRVTDVLSKNKIPFHFLETQYAGHATQIAKKYYELGHRNFLCLGGDGTLFEIINGFYEPLAQHSDVNLGVIPTGTGNSFLKDFSKTIDQTLEAIIHQRTQPSDIIEVKHSKGTLYFINIFSFGFTSQVGMFRNKYFSFAGPMGYVFSVFCKLLHLAPSPYRMKIDQQPEIETSSVFISLNNTRFTGGNMMMAPTANPNDGKIDIIDAKAMSRWKLLKAFPRIFQGTHTDLPEVTSTKAREIDFRFDHEIPVMIDGELLHIQPESLKVIPKGIQIYA